MARESHIELHYGDWNGNWGTIESFDYTDCAGTTSDEISLQIDNIDQRWNNGWLPKPLDNISAWIKKTDDNGNTTQLACGTFILDDFTVKAPPLTVSISAVSTPVEQGFKNTTRTKVWKEVTVKQIATEIASTANVELVFDASDTEAIKELEQSNETDAAFLSKLCEDYSLVMKVYSSKIIIYDEAAYEEKEPVAIITPSDCSTWTYNTSVYGSYTGAVFSYTDAKKNKTYTVNVGSGTRLLYINDKADNDADAEKKALAKINEENRSLITMSIQLKLPQFITATTTITLKDFGGLDGKYFVTKVKHSIGSGHNVTLELRKVVERVGKPAAADENADTNASGSYTVVSGDCLWNIAKKPEIYGDAKQWTKIYDANSDLIEQVAKSHGKQSSDHGHWIWAGTVLTIPR